MGNPSQRRRDKRGNIICLVGGLEPWTFMTFHSVGNVITPSDELIFFRGVGQPPTSCLVGDHSPTGIHHCGWLKSSQLTSTKGFHDGGHGSSNRRGACRQNNAVELFLGRTWAFQMSPPQWCEVMNGNVQDRLQKKSENTSELVGGLEHFIFFHILGTIIPFDFHIFQRGRYTTNQWKKPNCKLQVLQDLQVTKNIKQLVLTSGFIFVALRIAVTWRGKALRSCVQAGCNRHIRLVGRCQILSGWWFEHYIYWEYNLGKL